jgi:hypothetical protein
MKLLVTLIVLGVGLLEAQSQEQWLPPPWVLVGKSRMNPTDLTAYTYVDTSRVSSRPGGTVLVWVREYFGSEPHLPTTGELSLREFDCKASKSRFLASQLSNFDTIPRYLEPAFRGLMPTDRSICRFLVSRSGAHPGSF